MKLSLSIVLFILPIFFSIFAGSTDKDDFLVAYTPGKDSCVEYQGIINLDDSFNKESVIATVCYKKYTYQFIASVETNNITGKHNISINMVKLCQRFNSNVNIQAIIDIVSNSNILIKKL